MYDNFKLLNYSNSLVSPELYARHLSRLFSGSVVDGLTLVPKTGLIVTLQSGNGLIPYGSGATASAREFSLVADFDITLDTADASNPRIDLIVIYVDMAVTLPGGTPTVANLDGPGVVKATFVKGTPNASPVDPTVGAIQTKIGASNPYIIVESVRVDATVTTIAANKITDRRVVVKSTAGLADGAVKNAHLNTTTGEPGGAWTAWTPTYTNVVVSSTVNAVYQQVGKTVRFRLLFNVTSVSGILRFTLPVGPSGNYTSTTPIHASVNMVPTNGSYYPGAIIPIATGSTTVNLFAFTAGGTYAGMTGTSGSIPETWNSSGFVRVSGEYEAA